MRSTPPLEPQLLAFFQHFLSGPRQIFVRARYLDPAGQLLLTYTITSGTDLNQKPYALSSVDTTFTGVDPQALHHHRLPKSTRRWRRTGGRRHRHRHSTGRSTLHIR